MIEPNDVVQLLKECDTAGDLEGVFVPAGTVRELVTVWLRVASMLESVEQNPGDHTRDERCAVSILLTGQCEHGSTDSHDTEPHHDKPSEPPLTGLGCGHVPRPGWCQACSETVTKVPTHRCSCGAEWPARFPDHPNLQCPNCGQLVQ
jgi:hypothetical protein